MTRAASISNGSMRRSLALRPLKSGASCTGVYFSILCAGEGRRGGTGTGARRLQTKVGLQVGTGGAVAQPATVTSKPATAMRLMSSFREGVKRLEAEQQSPVHPGAVADEREPHVLHVFLGGGPHLPWRHVPQLVHEPRRDPVIPAEQLRPRQKI